jgi:uncharacterized membrane protein
MARIFSIRPTATFRGRKFKGLRGWAGRPSHPPLTDFPIVCYVLAGVFDATSVLIGEPASRDFFVAGTYVIVAGFVGSLAAILTGFWDWLRSTPKRTQVWRTANWHMTVMFAVTLVVILDMGLRLGIRESAGASAAVATLSVLAAVLVGYGAMYGGTLVYEYQFNVEGLEGSTVWDEGDQDQLPGQRES